MGGKHDDVTITVAQIFREDVHPMREPLNETVFPLAVTVYTEAPTAGDKAEQVKSKIVGWDEL